MIPRPSYPLDAQQRAQDLAGTILSAATPPQISAACLSIGSFLLRHSVDNPRAFFSSAFPALLSRLFGFTDSSSSPPSSSSAWIDVASADLDLASVVFDLLSPSGNLLCAIAAADRISLVKYIFPNERLPEWMRSVLLSPDRRCSSNISVLCPVLKQRIVEDSVQGNFQLQLNVFEYYMFWFAYFPVCRGNAETVEPRTSEKNRKFRLESWTASLPALTSIGRRTGQKLETDLYMRLLYAYLAAFVPKRGVGSYLPYRSSLLHYSSSYDASAFMQAEFFVYTLVHFWMVDNDFSPLPVKLCRSFGFSFPFRAVLGDAPPTAGLAEVLMLFVKYLNCNMIVPPEEENHQKVFDTTPVRTGGLMDVDQSRIAMVTYENSFGSWNSVIQRPVYRYILRTFLFCPMGTSLKNASDVLSLWVTYVSPWKCNPEDFAVLEMPLTSSFREPLAKNNASKTICCIEPSYTTPWQSYVLSNYLFYSSLFVHFLGFAHKFLNENVEMVIQMVLKVLTMLTSSRELVDLLRKVDTAYHSKQTSSSLHPSDKIHTYIPSIREQLQDWEDGLCENDADGSYLHENWNGDLKLFSESEDGAQNLLQLFVLRAEHEIQISAKDISQNLSALDSVKDQMNVLFGCTFRPLSPILCEDRNSVPVRGEVFSPKHPYFGKRKWDDIRYKGDWMRRPISDHEVAWLAKLLIRASDCLNKSLGLDGGYQAEPCGPVYVGLTHVKASSVRGLKEALALIVAQVGSWLAVLGQMILSFMRSHGMRINLRWLASKICVFPSIVFAVIYVLKKIISLSF